MKKTASEAEQLRSEVGGRMGKRGPLPAALRERGKQFARTRARAGASAAVISAELGMSVKTIERWLAPERSTAMVPVRVVAERAAAPRVDRIVITTACGLRIEGLDVDALCALVSRCG